MLFLTVIFVAIDYFYIAWAFQARDKFPGAISQSITQALFGMLDKINIDILAMITKRVKPKEGGFL